MRGVPEHLRRYPTSAGRNDLAARLGLSAVDPRDQDWEWQFAEAEMFDKWLAVYRSQPLCDDERFSLMEMLIQCVEDTVEANGSPVEVDAVPQWQAVAALLMANPQLHATSIAYWSVLGHGDPDAGFRVSAAMRRVWAVSRCWRRASPSACR